MADTPESCADIQRDLSWLEKWADSKPMRFRKYKDQHLGNNKLRLGIIHLGNGFAEKVMGAGGGGPS